MRSWSYPSTILYHHYPVSDNPVVHKQTFSSVLCTKVFKHAHMEMCHSTSIPYTQTQNICSKFPGLLSEISTYYAVSVYTCIRNFYSTVRTVSVLLEYFNLEECTITIPLIALLGSIKLFSKIKLHTLKYSPNMLPLCWNNTLAYYTVYYAIKAYCNSYHWQEETENFSYINIKFI